MNGDNLQHPPTKSDIAKTLSAIALLLSAAALVLAFLAFNKAEEVRKNANTTTGNGSQQQGLMQGTEQPPVLPPTQQ